MLRRVRHKLRMIRYYSAQRRQTVWSRAFDASLVLTLVLAPPVVWVADQIRVERAPSLTASGLFVRQPGSASGELKAFLSKTEKTAINTGMLTPAGNFSLQVIDEHRGWPLTTSVRRLPATIDIDILSEARPRPNVALSADDPLRTTITQALQADGRDELLSMWGAPGSPEAVEPQLTIHWIRWLLATALWWVMLMFAAFLLIQLARLTWILMRSRQIEINARRRSSNQCTKCGYDMTGLEFNERCPECGEIVW